MRILLAAACLALTSAAAAQTIYKYRGADGRFIFSDKPVPGARLIESFALNPSPPVRQQGLSESEVQGDERIRQRLAALEAAWKEVLDSERALSEAEARLAAGAEPLPGEWTGLPGPAFQPPPPPGEPVPPNPFAPPEVGGPQAPVPPQVGGPQAPASPAVGGPMNPRRGGRPNPDYVHRTATLEAAVRAARARNDAAWRAYNQLR